jgi:hypothetical protein
MNEGEKRRQTGQVARITDTKSDSISRFGFRVGKGGAHIARTMMLEELQALLAYVNRPDTTKDEYLRAIVEDNCLGKRSAKTRKLTGGHLVHLYSLDPAMTIFRALLYFWKRDSDGQPLLTLLCAYSRDAILRMSASFILRLPDGEIVNRKALEEHIEDKEPGRFSKATLKSAAQNINSTWTQSGHLTGRVRKIRSQATPTTGSLSYALLLGYLTGVRGESLFRTEYAKLLDCSFNKAVELAEEASRKGWIVFKRVGDVMEVLFPNLINAQEMDWLREQG